jgi:hypothetical protein
MAEQQEDKVSEHNHERKVLDMIRQGRVPTIPGKVSRDA